MKQTTHTTVYISSFCSRRGRIYPILVLALIVFGVVLYNITDYLISQNTEEFEPYTCALSKVEPLQSCLLPGSYTPQPPDTCVLAADGGMRVVPGENASVWNEGECEATLLRLAPWLKPTRQDLAAAPPLLCKTRGSNADAGMPLFVVQKTKWFYSVTEPQWASVSVASPQQNPNAGTPHDGDEYDYNNNEYYEDDEYKEETFHDATPGCPDLYLTSHTLLFGQTFNQFQSIVSGIWMSKVFKRTYVLPPFSVSGDIKGVYTTDTEGKHHTTLERYFDFNKLRRAGYCIVRYSTFAARVGDHCAKAGNCTMVYYEKTNQRYYPKLFKKSMVNVAPILAPPDLSNKPLMFSVSFRNLTDVLPDNALAPMSLPSAPLVMIENVVAFYVRAPFKDYIRILGLLEPSDDMAAKVDEVLRPQRGQHTIALHLRYREGTCVIEQDEFHRYLSPPTHDSTLPFTRDDGGRKSIVDECAYTAEQAMQRIRFTMDHLLPAATCPPSVSLLLATDNQRKREIARLRKGATKAHFRLYSAEGVERPKWCRTKIEKNVFDVVLDYFLLVRADVFFGNRMSSISQSACLARLGQGRSCYGEPVGHLRALFYPNVEHGFHR